MTSRRITVRVIGSDGRPVSQSAVAIVASTVPLPEIALQPNDAGLVLLNLPAGGQFTLRAPQRRNSCDNLADRRPARRDHLVLLKMGTAWQLGDGLRRRVAPQGYR
jgi:hypothetical protein